MHYDNNSWKIHPGSPIPYWWRKNTSMSNIVGAMKRAIAYIEWRKDMNMSMNVEDVIETLKRAIAYIENGDSINASREISEAKQSIAGTGEKPPEREDETSDKS